MTHEEILNVARAVALNERWQVSEAGVVIDEKRWLFGTTAWRVEFERLDRPATSFVRIDARTGDVLATGWRAAAADNVRALRRRPIEREPARAAA